MRLTDFESYSVQFNLALHQIAHLLISVPSSLVIVTMVLSNLRLAIADGDRLRTGSVTHRTPRDP